ncbi:unnamed protein product [Malus baccata var. baccata]
MGDPLGSSAYMSSEKQNHEGIIGAQSRQYRATHEAFWKLTGFGFRKNSEVKRGMGQSIYRMGDPLESSARMSSQKQNHENVIGVQKKQYRATTKLSPEYDGA